MKWIADLLRLLAPEPPTSRPPVLASDASPDPRRRRPRPDPLPPELRKDLAEWCELWRVPELASQIEISFSHRLRRSLGRCHPKHAIVRLHPGLVESPEVLREVLCHEVAHAAAYALYRRRLRPHGREWGALMRAAGYRPRATYREPAVRNLLKREPAIPIASARIRRG